MAADKRIIIGCDNAVNLTAVLDSMKETTLFLHNIITATRPSDITGLVRSFEPHLLILCFRNNQSVLDDLNANGKKIPIPVFCLTGKWENETLSWNKNNIVFTCPLEHIYNSEYLHFRINSVFLLIADTYKKARDSNHTSSSTLNNQPANSRNLSRYVMELDQKTEMLLKVKDRIANLHSKAEGHTKAELMSIINLIKMSGNNHDLWGDFKLFFEETDPEFLPLLSKKFPFLTPIDLKYCCYLKMNMTNDDIKKIFGISLESVRTHKYRLKKKMSLAKNDDLRNYLRSVA